jgi:peptide/nickel transport system ATP-binding protein/oligopeptide transport system ATP-binding protein
VFAPCPDVDPALQPVGSAPGHLAACHLHGVVGTPAAGAGAVPADGGPGATASGARTAG